MKAKLIKTQEGYTLNDVEGNPIGQTFGKFKGKKLSLKNCQAIELGYDLDELVKEELLDINTKVHKDLERDGWIKIGLVKGFQKALEIRSDKKFSSRNILKSFTTGVFTDENSDYDFEFTELMKDLQQTEWDVEVEMKDSIALDGHTIIGTEPKLDEDGCLILKRI